MRILVGTRVVIGHFSWGQSDEEIMYRLLCLCPSLASRRLQILGNHVQNSSREPKQPMFSMFLVPVSAWIGINGASKRGLGANSCQFWLILVRFWFLIQIYRSFWKIILISSTSSSTSKTKKVIVTQNEALFKNLFLYWSLLYPIFVMFKNFSFPQFKKNNLYLYICPKA